MKPSVNSEKVRIRKPAHDKEYKKACEINEQRCKKACYRGFPDSTDKDQPASLFSMIGAINGSSVERPWFIELHADIEVFDQMRKLPVHKTSSFIVHMI